MSKTTKIILGVVVAIVVIAGIWYGVSRKPASTPITKEPIKIGASLMLSGQYAKYGEQEMNGIELALDKIRRDKIKVIYEDNQADTKKAVTDVQKLINVDKVKIILGPDCGSGCTLAAAPITEKANVIQMSIAASNPQVAKAGEKVFTLVALDDYESKIMAEHLIKMGIKKIAIINVNDEWGVNQKNMFTENFSKRGGKVSIAESYKRGAKDFRTLLVKIKSDNPDAIFFAGYDEIIELIKQMKELGIEKQIISNSMIENIQELDQLKQVLKQTGFKIIYTSQQFEFNKTIAEEFRNKYNKNMDLFAANGYDSLMIAYKAIESCGKVDTNCIASFIYGLKDYPGASGNITITPDGWRKANILIKTMQ